ncbi:MAG: HlyD family efflux transporter periplasmic adaptor subunit [Burkholderiales bacterium]|nr:HlyD family efflux transporter periplasmic adaptor subunit [Burkholderiales bacterium]
MIRPVSFQFLTAVAVLIAGAVVAFLTFAQYASKARVTGMLVPEQGLIKVYTPQPGVVSERKVREGDVVHRGDVMYILSAELANGGHQGLQAEVGNLLNANRESLEREKSQQAELLITQRNALTNRLENLHQEADRAQSMADIQKQRTQLADKTYQRFKDLASQGFVSQLALQQKEEDAIDQRTRLKDMERTTLDIRQQASDVAGQLAMLPLKQESSQEALDRTILNIQQSEAENNSHRQLVIRAPSDGTVTAIMADVGGTIAPTTPMVSLLPAGSKLQAQLYAPSRAIGFVKPGQHVMVRYQAFPYQKFGQYAGTVSYVSRTALANTEVGTAAQAASDASEPLYRVTVDLDQQQVSAYGESRPLQAGMQVEADIVVDRRHVLEWIFEPLISLKGKL